MDIKTYVENGVSAERQGVPVNWREACIHVAQAAVNKVAELEAKLDKLTAPSGEGSPSVDMGESAVAAEAPDAD